MSDETTVEWIADERTVPYVGRFERGKKYTLPTAQAQQFIEGGNAKPATATRARSVTTEE